MICQLCQKEITKNPIKHHISYDPEIIMDLCYPCHNLIHNLNKLSIESIAEAIQLVLNYGHLWENGFEKYRNSESYKENQSKWHKKYYQKFKDTERYKKYRETYYNKNKKKMISQTLEARRRRKLQNGL